MSSNPTVVVTGVAGNLGRRLLPHLEGFDVIGLDLHSPRVPLSPEPIRFENIDLGREASCAQLVSILREHDVRAVVHLAFVIDPMQTGILDVDRIWQINVVGTARVMEAIAEVNRTGGAVETFVFPSSVSAYGPDIPDLVDENYPLGAHTLPYAIHKKESDEVAQQRATSLGVCGTFILRPHIFAGASMQNYLVGALRGTATGKGNIAMRLREKGKRLPMMLPFGDEYLEKKFQFVHVDDVARLIAHILHRGPHGPELHILNVTGRGDALTIARCAEIGHTKILRLPGRTLCRLVLKLIWEWGVSSVPPDALPYIIGSYTMDTSRLKTFLGSEYEKVIRFTIEEALADSFNPDETVPAKAETPTMQTV